MVMTTRALIFDMDGVLIDSEPLWRQAEIEVFRGLGLDLDEAMCRETTGLRIDETVRFWYDRYPWIGPILSEVGERVVVRVCDLIRSSGRPVRGAVEVIERVRKLRVRTALASSSPSSVIRSVLRRLDLDGAFDAVCSAETEEFGKPHPAIYLTAARCLSISPAECVAVEDSVRGLMSARAAGIRCIALPALKDRGDPEFERLSDAVLDSLELANEKWLHRFLFGGPSGAVTDVNP